MGTKTNPEIRKETPEMKQAFLSSAISDISAYIQMADTKVSIIMAAMVALIAIAASCHEAIFRALANIRPISCLGVAVIIFSVALVISLIAVFVFGILTIGGHSSMREYKSKWFILESTEEYSFDAYKKDIQLMKDEDIIENMAAELYKLNDINRQKIRTNRWVIRSFAATLIETAILCALFAISAL